LGADVDIYADLLFFKLILDLCGGSQHVIDHFALHIDEGGVEPVLFVFRQDIHLQLSCQVFLFLLAECDTFAGNFYRVALREDDPKGDAEAVK